MREVTAENSKISPTYINKQVVGPSLYRALQEAAKAKRIHGNGMLLLLYIFLNAKPMMNWHLPQLQRNYFWAKSCRAFVQLWHWILVYYCCGGCECSIVMHCNGEELGHLNLVFLKSYNFWSILIRELLLFRQIKNLSLVSRHFYVLEFEPTWIFSKFYL